MSHDNIAAAIDAFIASSNLIDTTVGAQALLLQQASRNEDSPQAIQANYEQAVSSKDAGRTGNFANHLAAIAEAIPAFNWKAMAAAGISAKEHIQCCKDAAQYFLFRVMKDGRAKNDNSQLDWAKQLETLITSINTANAANGKGLDDAMSDRLSKMSLASSLDALAAPKKMETSASGSLSKQAAAPKPARVALEGNRWYVENHTSQTNGQGEIVVEIASLQQGVYIFNCADSVVQIKGKAAAVSIERCSRVGVVVQDIVSAVEVVNSKKCQVQITGHSPTISVENTDGLQIYLNQASRSIEIMTAKSSEINVCMTRPAENGSASADAGDMPDIDEIPIPEQFKSTFDEHGKLVTVPASHASA